MVFLTSWNDILQTIRSVEKNLLVLYV